MQRIHEKTAPEAAYTSDIPNTPIGFILHAAKTHWHWGLSAAFFVIFAQTLGASMSYLISLIVDAVIDAPTVEAQLDELYFWGVAFIIYSVVLYSSWRLAGFVGAVFVVRQNKTAMETLFQYVVKHSHSYFSDHFAGSISNKISNAGDGGARLLERSLFGVLQQTVLVLTLGIILATIHIGLTGIFLVTTAIVVILNVQLMKWRRPHVVAYSTSSSILRGEGVDLLTNIQATRQYVRVPHELDRMFWRVTDRAKKDIKQWYIGEYINLINNGIAVLLTATVILLTYQMLESGTATAGELILVMLVMFRVAGALVHVGEMMNSVIRVYGEVEEGLLEVTQPYEITDKEGAADLLVTDCEVVWQNVGFDFDENAVFEDFNVTIKPGERVGLVGPSGAGKTTFVSLLLRQHDIDDGEILIDGQNIAEVTQDSLRENIAVVPQEPLLFHRTIRDNIAYGKLDATDEEIEKVAKMAEAHDFITELPDGYDTLVGERGVKLSGGQRQRVAIARAMLKDAPLLVLDEATSALDSESEVAIQKALHELMEGKTVVAIAHRLSTLREMDRIIVLESGRIVEDGTHEKLTKSGGTYARLWEHQAGGFLQD